MNRSPRSRPDAKTRALVPAVGAVLLVSMAGVDAWFPGPARARALAASPSRTQPASNPRIVAVRIGAASQSSIAVSVRGPYRVYAGRVAGSPSPTARPLAAGDGLKQAHVTVDAAGLRMNGTALGVPEATIIPESDGFAAVDDTGYRGNLWFRAPDARSVRVVNLVPIEPYVAGVLFAEMPRRFGVEALRAQAVAIRSFALSQVDAGRELRDDQGSQVYRGLKLEDDYAREIVLSTEGEVLWTDRGVLCAYFHSSCGGFTSASRDVFDLAGTDGLGGGAECRGCPRGRYRAWERRIPHSEIAMHYRGALGERLSFRVARTDAHGRALAVEIVSMDGVVVDTLPAARFTGDWNVGRRLDDQILSTFFHLVRADADAVHVKGTGFGHGVGLCQYGADADAKSGARYKEILARYYAGASLRRHDENGPSNGAVSHRPTGR